MGETGHLQERLPVRAGSLLGIAETSGPTCCIGEALGNLHFLSSPPIAGSQAALDTTSAASQHRPDVRLPAVHGASCNAAARQQQDCLFPAPDVKELKQLHWQMIPLLSLLLVTSGQSDGPHSADGPHESYYSLP